MGNVPSVTLSILDGTLGLLPPDVSGLSAKIGPCSSGVVNAITSFSNKDDLVAALGFGPLVEAAAHHIEVSGQPVICVRATSTNGANSAVTKVGTGTSVMTVGGTPGDVYDAIFEIVKPGASLAAATASFKYTLDGGKTYSAEIALPVSGIFPVPNTGLTVTWAAGTFVAADTYSFTSTAPTNDNTAIGLALDALLADSREWGFVHIVGPSDATKATTVHTKLLAAESTKFRYAFAILETLDPAADEAGWITATLAVFAAFASARVMISAGYCRLVSAITGRLHRRSGAWPIAARTAKAPISESLGRVASGSLPGVTELFHNADVTATMADARYATLRTHVGRAGFFITRGQMFAQVGSDYNVVQRRRVMDRACQVVRQAMLFFLEESVPVNTKTGGIDEATAISWETQVKGQLDAALLSDGHATATAIKIDRAVNILSTEKVKTKVSVTPLAYAKDIVIEIGFFNPALAAVAA